MKNVLPAGSSSTPHPPLHPRLPFLPTHRSNNTHAPGTSPSESSAACTYASLPTRRTSFPPDPATEVRARATLERKIYKKNWESRVYVLECFPQTARKSGQCQRDNNRNGYNEVGSEKKLLATGGKQFTVGRRRKLSFP